MKLPEIEALLSQEMEVVMGGNQGPSGTCTCETGAGQSAGTGHCICTKGGAGQQSIPQPPSSGCTCPSGAGQ